MRYVIDSDINSFKKFMDEKWEITLKMFLKTNILFIS
jgi:hypothetical protein